jgi:hypothetical protein
MFSLEEQKGTWTTLELKRLCKRITKTMTTHSATEYKRSQGLMNT